MPVTIDTFKVYERLIRANLDEPAAKELAEIFKEIAESHLATKEDIEKLKLQLNSDIAAIKVELSSDIEKAKGEIIKWVAGMLVAQAAVVATLIKLLS
jgi:hypothetical protein